MIEGKLLAMLQSKDLTIMMMGVDVICGKGEEWIVSNLPRMVRNDYVYSLRINDWRLMDAQIQQSMVFIAKSASETFLTMRTLENIEVGFNLGVLYYLPKT